MFIADVGGGAMTAVIGILAALFGRERHGEGASLDISMHDAALYWVMVPAARDLVDGGAQAAGELPTFGAHACYNVYRTRDGQLVALGALERKFWVAFCEAIGRPDLAARHATGEADQAALIDEMRALFADTHARRVAVAAGEPRRLSDAGQHVRRRRCAIRTSWRAARSSQASGIACHPAAVPARTARTSRRRRQWAQHTDEVLALSLATEQYDR